MDVTRVKLKYLENSISFVHLFRHLNKTVLDRSSGISYEIPCCSFSFDPYFALVNRKKQDI
jgi:hypothetical protein